MDQAFLSTFRLSNVKKYKYNPSEYLKEQNEKYKNKLKKDEASFMEMKYINPTELDAKTCNEFYVRNLEDSQLCLGFPKSVRAICASSSIGGGYFQHKQDFDGKITFLTGVATHEMSHCANNELMPVIFTDVANFSDWISRTIKEASSTRGADKGDGEDKENAENDEVSTVSSRDERRQDLDHILAGNETRSASNFTMSNNNETEDLFV